MLTSELFERITRQIADAIEAGAETFRMPWHHWGNTICAPVNAVSGRPYRGVNTLLLWAAAESSGYSSGRWATYRQWAASGAQVRKSETATPILFWKSAANDVGGAAGGGGEGEEEGTNKPRFIARLYSVFNADQVEGAAAQPSSPRLSAGERVAAAETFFAGTGAHIRHGGDKACFVPSIDQIWVPCFEQFRDAESYYSTLAHEAVHWSGAKQRLNRDMAGKFGNESYAMEELVAELGAAFIAAKLEISIEPRRDHASYIASWLQVLHDDPRAILTAASKAQEAVDYLFELVETAMESASPSKCSVGM